MFILIIKILLKIILWIYCTTEYPDNNHIWTILCNDLHKSISFWRWKQRTWASLTSLFKLSVPWRLFPCLPCLYPVPITSNIKECRQAEDGSKMLQTYIICKRYNWEVQTHSNWNYNCLYSCAHVKKAFYLYTDYNILSQFKYYLTVYFINVLLQTMQCEGFFFSFFH